MVSKWELADDSRVARISQGGGGGLFWKFDTTVNELDPNFHQPWIRFKKKGLHRNSKGFYGRIQVISKKKKVFTDFGWVPEPENSTILVQITASLSQLPLTNPVGGYFQYLNCRGSGGDTSPRWAWASPHQDWASPHRDLSTGWWEEKDLQSPVEHSAKFRGNSDWKEKTLQVSAKTFFFGLQLISGEKTLQFSAKTFFFSDFT